MSSKDKKTKSKPRRGRDQPEDQDGSEQRAYGFSPFPPSSSSYPSPYHDPSSPSSSSSFPEFGSSPGYQGGSFSSFPDHHNPGGFPSDFSCSSSAYPCGFEDSPSSQLDSSPFVGPSFQHPRDGSGKGSSKPRKQKAVPDDQKIEQLKRQLAALKKKNEQYACDFQNIDEQRRQLTKLLSQLRLQSLSLSGPGDDNDGEDDEDDDNGLY